MIKRIYNNLSKPESSGKEIGLFRSLIAIFGGLLCSYLAMTLLAFLLPDDISKTAIISIMFNTFTWACTATWIVLSYTKLEALLKFLIPTILISIILYIKY